LCSLSRPLQPVVGAPTIRTYVLTITRTLPALFRLVRPGDAIFDCGANIGYMTSVMSYCCGSTGLVAAFEPNPRVLKVLNSNAERWSQERGAPQIRVMSYAVGNHIHDAQFHLSDWDSAVGRLASSDEEGLTVKVTTLDQAVTVLARCPSLIKIDTEGHELEALQGAASLLEGTELRHVVLEDWEMGYSPAISHLRKLGFSIFAIDRSWHGPELAPDFQGRNLPSWEAPNFLATRDEAQVRALFHGRGWRCLGW